MAQAQTEETAFGQHGHTSHGRGDLAAELPIDQIPLAPQDTHVADTLRVVDFPADHDPDTAAASVHSISQNNNDDDGDSDIFSALHGATAAAHSTPDHNHRVRSVHHNPGQENSGESSGGSGGNDLREEPSRGREETCAGSSLGGAEVTTIVRALERLEGRLGARLDGIEKMLRNVSERVGLLERAANGPTAGRRGAC